MGYSLKDFRKDYLDSSCKISNDGTLVYRNDGVYARLINKKFIYDTDCRLDVTAPRNYTVFENEEATLIVSTPKGSHLTISEEDTGFEFVGYFSVKSGMTPNEVDFFSYAYVPFMRGPQNSIIPVMWRTVDKYDGEIIPVYYLQDALLYQGVMNEAAKDFASLIEEKFPSVDLREQKDERYIGVPMEMYKGPTLSIMYNRNHIAYNGNLSSEIKLLPIICAIAAWKWDEIIVETLSQYLNDEYRNDLILSTTYDITPKHKFLREPGSYHTYDIETVKRVQQRQETYKKESEELETEANPLLRAAKIAGGNVK